MGKIQVVLYFIDNTLNFKFVVTAIYKLLIPSTCQHCNYYYFHLNILILTVCNNKIKFLKSINL